MTNTDEPLDCELCIVGAGYAALNGLNAAAKYLKRGARVVVIDRNATWGGQWLHQYDFVRLHQPYRMFTAGDQPWALKRDPSHLASRTEVLDHFATVPSVSARHLELRPLFGYAYDGHEVRAGRVEVRAAPTSGNAGAVRVRAKRMLNASGVDIEILPPYPISSTRVKSVAVADPLLTTREFLEGSEPVYIIGSGKTAMDCARQLIQHRRDRRREIHVIAGSGMWFFVRDNIYPAGLQRYVRGTLNTDVFLTMCELFDGHNETAVMKHLEARGYMHKVWEGGDNCRLGTLSIAEREQVHAGVDRVFPGHLVDVDGTRMTLRHGDTLQEHSVPEGAYFINCTSHLRARPHQPVLQDSGLVCAPQFCLGLTGSSAYFITHAWYRGDLSSVAPELFRMRLDIEPKLRFTPNLGVMVLANMMLLNARLSPSIAARYAGDFNKWYPPYRRIPMFARLLGKRRMLLEKAERLLRLRFADALDDDEHKLTRAKSAVALLDEQPHARPASA